MDATHQCTENDSEEVELGRGVRETPQQEGDDSTPYGAEEHYPGIGEAVAHMAEDNLTRDGGRVEYREDDGSREWIGESAREACNVQ